MYSPLSWEFDIDFLKCFEIKPQFNAAIEQNIGVMTDRIGERVRLLADLFDCNTARTTPPRYSRASNDTKRSVDCGALQA